ncbi:Ig-like domain-containing protein [Kitasatospora sp. KL5]|uniref:Ig-like domain-containing protein n=1 Tax=Kitasatospora sp. KL5 TaxID=3425125 RepID=UPI003D6ED4A4
MNRRFPPAAVPRRALAAAAAAGLLLPAAAAGRAPAQQTPSGWSQERRATLPSGLTVQLDLDTLPGITAKASPGTLGEHAGSGAAYTDGLRAGDPAEIFAVTADRPSADGSWRTIGTLRIAFSRPVRNPRLHVSGLTARATATTGTTATAVRLAVADGTPTAPALVGRTAWTGWTVTGNELSPPADADADGIGTLELTGTVGTATLRLEQRTTARDGSTTPPPPLRTAVTVTVDESLGTAPQGYGNASHLLSDLWLGRDAADEAHRARAVPPAATRPLVAGPGAATTSSDAEPAATRPLVEIAFAGPHSIWAAPRQPRSGPGRSEYAGDDPTLAFPAEAATGDYYRLDVPVAPGGGPAVLAGWVDFDRNGRFDPMERVQAEVPTGATGARLEWAVTGRVVAGETWARLRIARDASQLVAPGGFADSGQVVDQRIRLAAGSVRPEITAPVDGAVTADVRPEIAGAGALASATVAVTEAGAELCRAGAAKDGGWSCRPAAPLADGPHTLVAVETTRTGAVLRSEPVRLAVKTAPPAAPVLTLPEFTNDPGLPMAGSGEPGSTVSVTDPGGTTPSAGELCSTGVGADGAWSCLPVENLADGVHRLTATAVDPAGNSTHGREAALTVDTAAPPRPVLDAPKAGETVGARPRFAGRAEPAATVAVTAGGADGRRRTARAVHGHRGGRRRLGVHRRPPPRRR